MAKPFVAFVDPETVVEFRGKHPTLDYDTDARTIDDETGYYVMIGGTGHGVFADIEGAVSWAREKGLELQENVFDYFEGGKWGRRPDPIPAPEEIPEAEAFEVERLELPERVLFEAEDGDDEAGDYDPVAALKATVEANKAASNDSRVLASLYRSSTYDKPAIDGAPILEAIRDDLAQDLIRQLDHDGHGNMYSVKRESNADDSVYSFSFFVGEHPILTVTITKGK